MKSKPYRKTIGVLKKIVLPVILISGCILGYLGELNISDKNHRPHLYGIWETKNVIKNKDTLPPLLTDGRRWRFLIIERKRSAIVKTMDEQLTRYNSSIDTINSQLKLINTKIETDTIKFKFEKHAPSALRLTGKMNNDDYIIELLEKPKDSFTLINTGFRWINERPFNK